MGTHDTQHSSVSSLGFMVYGLGMGAHDKQHPACLV